MGGLSAASKGIVITDEMISGISATLNDEGKIRNDNAVYDLQGRRVSAKAKKGLYIINGRKAFVK